MIPPSFRTPLSWLTRFVAMFALLFLTACRGPSMMTGTFIDYSQAYAETSNQQMLLNLARRANSHPVYFLQMGSVSSTFIFGVNGGGNAGQTRTHNGGTSGGYVAALSDMVTFGGTLGASATEQPTFSFTPLSGSAFAAAMFAPLDEKVFFALFDQGYPVDLLMRVMVQSVTFTTPQGSRTYINVSDSVYPWNYRDFLIMADLSRYLQEKQMMWAAPDRTSFSVSERAGEELRQLTATNRYYAVQSDKLPMDEVKGTNKTAGVTLKFRTFTSMLSALADEATDFDAIKARAGTKFFDSLPPAQRRPILQIHADQFHGRISPPVVSLNYRGSKYVIADEEEKDPVTGKMEFSTWNRDVFNILNQIYVQIALDPGKLPMQQLIQVH